MGKRLIIILISIILYLPVLGQTEPRPLDKGQNYIGYIGWISHSKNFYSDYWSYYSSVRYGRFVFNKFAIGANANFQGYSRSDFSNTLGLVPFARYYILNRKISPVLEVHYNHEIRFPYEYSDKTSSYYNKFNLGAGITFNRILLNRFGAELVIFYGHNNDVQHWYLDGLFYLTYHFPKR